MGRGPYPIAAILPSMSSACLNLVEDDEGASFGHDFLRLELDDQNDARDVVAQLELFVHPGVVVEVRVCDVLELRPAEFFGKSCLSNLMRVVENGRIAGSLPCQGIGIPLLVACLSLQYGVKQLRG